MSNLLKSVKHILFCLIIFSNTSFGKEFDELLVMALDFFGSTVKLVDLESNKKKTYKIVGEDEADLAKNLIYFKSPIARALIGKSKKNLITVVTPSGEKKFEIVEVKYI